MIAYGGRGFQIKVNTKTLKQFVNGSTNDLKNNGYKPVYTAEVLGFDSKNLKAGPLFRIPITVVNPLLYTNSFDNSKTDNVNSSFSDNNSNNWSLSGNDSGNTNNNNSNNVFEQIDDFKVGTIARVFHAVPQGVCAAKVTINAIKTGNDKPTRFSFATLYNKGYQHVDYDRWFRASTGSTFTAMIKVESSTVLETTVTQYALDDNICRLKWRIEFIGPIISSDHIYLNLNKEYTEVSMYSNIISATNIKPNVSFDRYITYVEPKYATIGTLSNNRGDITVNDELYYSLDLEYEFDSECSGDTYFNIPKISNLLYESYLGGIFYMVFNKYKKLVGSGEAFRETIKMDKLDKYLYKIQIRHSSLKLLESLKSLKLQINYPLSSSLSCDIYYGPRSMLQSKNKVSTVKLTQFNTKRLYITSPNKDKISVKKVKQGDHLSGWLKFDNNLKNFLKPRFRNTGTSGDASYCIPIECVLGPSNGGKPKSRNEEENGNGDSKDNKDKEEEDKPTLEEKQRDMTIDWIKKLKGKEQLNAFEKYVTNGLIKEYPKHLQLLELQMNVYSNAMKEKGNEKYSSMVSDTCDAILNAIDPMAVSAHFGRNGNKDDKEWIKADKKYTEEKEFIIKALFQKLRLLYGTLSKEHETAQKTELEKNPPKSGGYVAVNSNGDTSVTTSGTTSNKSELKDDGKQDEKIDTVLTNDSNGQGQTTGITADNNIFETSLYERNDDINNPYRMVYINKDKLDLYDNLIKDLSQWTDLDKNKTYKDEYFDMKLFRLSQDYKYGEIYKLINENDFNNDKEKSYNKKLDILKKYWGNSFGYLIEQKELSRYIEFPKDYRLF